VRTAVEEILESMQFGRGSNKLTASEGTPLITSIPMWMDGASVPARYAVETISGSGDRSMRPVGYLVRTCLDQVEVTV